MAPTASCPAAPAAARPGPWAEMFEETQHRYKFDGRLRAEELCRTAVNVPVLAAEAVVTAAAAMRQLPADGVASAGDGPAAAAASARAHSMIGAVCAPDP